MTAVPSLPNLPPGYVDDPAAIDSLDGMLDALVAGARAATSDGLEPSLVATVTRVHAIMVAPEPDPVFAASLRRSLLANSATEPPLHRDLARTRPVGPIGFLPTGRWWPATELAAMVLVVVALLSTLTAGETLLPRIVDLAGLRQDIPADGDVPMFRNDPAGAAEQPGPAPTGRPTIRWQFRTGAGITGSPVIVDGIIYFGTFSNRLYAVDARTGMERWTFDAGATVRTPTVVDDTAYFVTDRGVLVAVDTATGTQRWRLDLKAGLVRPPTVVDGTVYLTSGEVASNNPAVVAGVVYAGGGDSPSYPGTGSILYAIDAATGQERWRLPIGGTTALYAVDAATGDERWRFPVEGAPWAAPAVADGLAFISTNYNGPLLAVDTATGQERWRYDASAGAGPVVVNGVLYGGNFALDAATGHEQWRTETIRPVHAAPAIVGETAYLMTERGGLHAVDAMTGAEHWHAVIGDQIVYALSPLVSNGFIYVAASDGSLYALGDALPNLSTPAARDVPASEECQGERLDPDDVAAFIGTPKPPTEPTPFVWPTGQPADAETVAAITATHRLLIACANAGDPLRMLPLYTAHYHASQPADSYPPEYYAHFATPQPLPPEQQTAILSITEVQVLRDGRVGALTTVEGRADLPHGPVISYVIFAKEGGRWLIDEVVTVDHSPQPPGPVAPTAAGTPLTTSSPVITVPADVTLNLRAGATFSATVVAEAPPGSVLKPTGAAVVIDGITWIPIERFGQGVSDHVPAAYLTAIGATIPDLPLVDAEGIGIPDPSECQVEPIPLEDVAAYMGPPGPDGPRNAMRYLATAGEQTDAETRAAVITTLREVFACHNAGVYTQSVALNTHAFYQQAGAGAYRPNGTETDLATPRPLPAEDRSEILAIGDTHLLDDNRVGVVMIGMSHDGPIQLGATYFILAKESDRWLVDDAISIEQSVRPGGRAPAVASPTPTPPDADLATGTPTATTRAVAKTALIATATAGTTLFPAEGDLASGQRAVVTTDGANLRTTPDYAAEQENVIGQLRAGDEVRITGAPVDSPDATWWPVEVIATGETGYIVANFLIPAGGSARASATGGGPAPIPSAEVQQPTPTISSACAPMRAMPTISTDVGTSGAVVAVACGE